MTLNGKHALITGGGTGIGLAIAQTLAAEGANVTITGRRLQVLQKAGAGFAPIAMDVTDEASVIDGVAQAVAANGPVDICIANAGIAEGGLIPKQSFEHWQRTISTNLDGAFLTIRECLRSMENTHWGRVIAISSIAGLKGLKGAAAYSASKHGVIGLIRALSEDYLGTGVTFNAVCPAYVDTDIVTRNTDGISKRAGISKDQALAMMLDANRHKRLIAPAEVASAVQWLCAPGSESVNGQSIEIAGGQY